MTIHDKLAERLRGDYSHTVDCVEAYQTRKRMDPDCLACEIELLAGEIEAGSYDDALGVREPTLDDVEREAERVYGPNQDVWVDYDECVKVDTGRLVWRAPTVASAYVALRTLPDWKGEG